MSKYSSIISFIFKKKNLKVQEIESGIKDS